MNTSIKFNDLDKLGTDIFGSKDEFNKWLNTKSYGLNNQIPANLLNTDEGIILVYEELIRIAYGATA